MRSVRRFVGIVVATVVVTLAVLPVTQASAQTTAQPAPLTASASPTSGPAGQSFKINWTVNAKEGCDQISVTGAPVNPAPTAVPLSRPASGAITMSVPRTAEQRQYSMTVYCSVSKVPVGYAVRGVLPEPTTTTPPPVTTTNPPVTTTTRPPVVTTTTRRPTTTTTRPTTTTTTPVTTTTETTPPTTDVPTTTPEITNVPEPKRDLKLDRESIQPGDSLEATGRGCDPNHTVLLTSGGEKVGATVADGQGDFRAKVQFSKIVPGRHLIAAECGIVLTGAVDQLVTSSTGGSSSTLVILVFFVLAGAALIRFT